MSYKLGFIGGGNMASALINGILSNNLLKPDQIITSVATEKSKERLASRFGIITTTTNTEVAQNCETLILAVKPYMIATVIDEIKSSLSHNQVVISIASGVKLDKLSLELPNQRIYRAMPNTPASVSLGMTSICTQLPESESSRQTVSDIFSAIGKIAWINEKLMHAAIAVHGSSPAYAFIMMEAMADAAVLEGMPRDKAYTMAAQSLLGAAQMVLSSGLHPAVLKDQVTSPGGNTIEAIAILEQEGFRSSIINAMRAAAQKSRDMENE